MAKAILFTLFAVSATVEAITFNGFATNQTCSEINQRKSWTALSDYEKAEYIRAEKCLMTSAPVAEVVDAGTYGTVKTIWDQIMLTHVKEGNQIHYTGQFLPWHRYYVRMHELLLQNQCNYTGAHPYWDETADLENYPGAMQESPIWDPNTGFGGNGSASTGCVTDGPFANLTIRISSHNKTDYCLTRELTQSDLDKASASEIETCHSKGNYSDAWQCYNGAPHGAGHGATGGLMADPIDSPGDPMFFMHHAFLDMLWWKWQLANYTHRLTDISGPNTMSQEILDLAGLSQPGTDVLDYDGDDGNVTTLNHNLYMVGGLVPNVTVGDVMQLNGSVICAEYIY